MKDIKEINMINQKNYCGLDILKFIMALFVVMIHVKPYAKSDFLTAMLKPMMDIAVPVFFVLSSVLIFSKLSRGGVNR